MPRDGQPPWALVALDIDDTILSADDRVSLPVLRSVRAVALRGSRLVLATGRGLAAARSAIDAMRLGPGHGIAGNGAVTFTLEPVVVTSQQTFDPRPVIERALARRPDAIFAAELVGVGYRVSATWPAGELGGSQVPATLAELAAEPVTRLVVRDPSAAPHTHDDHCAPDVSKATALARICDQLGVAAADVLAIGDGTNDLNMLRWAGRGVAMGHAPQEVRNAADAVTGSLAEDGVSTELDRWFGPPD